MNIDLQNDELQRLAKELGATVMELEDRLEMVVSIAAVSSCTIDAQCFRSAA